MNKKLLLTIGKWIAMAILLASNYMFYMVNDTTINLALTLIIILYSFYEFFLALSGKNLKLGLKFYLFSFYMFAVLSLIISVRSLLADEFTSALTSLIIMAGDAALIIYTLYRMTHPERYR